MSWRRSRALRRSRGARPEVRQPGPVGGRCPAGGSAATPRPVGLQTHPWATLPSSSLAER
eukprot:scaffold3467_cov120-Isochrysis_galbana.AAC.4